MKATCQRNCRESAAKTRRCIALWLARTSLSIPILLFGSVFGLDNPSHSADPDATLIHYWSRDSVVSELARRFAERVYRSSDKKLLIIGDGRVSRPSEQAALLSYGKVEFIIDSFSIKREIPELRFFEVPFLIRDEKHLRSVFDVALRGRLSDLFLKRGYTLVASLYLGKRYISSRDRPIIEPYDLEGQRIGIADSTWLYETFKQFGATPTTIPRAEALNALEAGVIDAQEGTLSNFEQAGIFKVQSHISLTGHIYEVAFLVTSTKYLRSLDANTADAILSAGRAVEHEAFTLVAKREDDLIGRLRDYGLSIHHVDDNAFRDYSKKSFDAFASDVPGGWDALNIVLDLAYR